MRQLAGQLNSSWCCPLDTIQPPSKTVSWFDVTDILDLFCSWRFYVASTIGLGLAYLIYASVTDEMLGLIFAIPVGLTGIIFGLVWEHRSGE